MSDCTVRPKLRECPFCGGENIQVIEYKAGYGTIGCGDCCFEYPDNGNLKPLDELREAWNTRAERTCRNTSTRLDESRFHCSECGVGVWVKHVSDGRDRLPNYCPNCGRKVKR